ncbi:MAG: hypothetical protein LBI42_10695 [Chitinispirillales bacterium]|jgi:hypothetical protein|nr:hypothetical protein [Chitinispirillales bacterium]
MAKYLSIHLLCLILLFCPGSLWSRGQTIAPAETDPSISRALEDHYVTVNPWVMQRDVLFLFFPGTKSRATNYTFLCEAAADQGFHAISLQYMNDISVNFTCSKYRNLDCYENMRQEILFGSDFSQHLNVNRSNSAENRLVKLLRYLSEQYPLDGWEQYLTSGGVPRWSKILVAGHSQGGGHAALLGKYYSTAGVIMLASMDYSFNRDNAGSWIHQEGNTAIEKYFAAAHMEDRTMPIAVMRRFWNSMGFRRLAPIINIDHAGFPYGNSHTLITSIKPSNVDKDKSNYHNALCMDADTPLSKEGKPLLLPLWNYLLNAPFDK